jgi:hypothetical protein
MLHVGWIVGGNGIGSGCSTMPPKPREGDFHFSLSLSDNRPYEGTHGLEHHSRQRSGVIPPRGAPCHREAVGP